MPVSDLGLIAYYPLENANDGSGQGRHLTNLNGVTFTPGKVVKAGTFVRASTQALYRSDAAFAVTSAISITAWVKLASKPVGGPMNAVDRHAAGLQGYSLFWDNAGDVFRMRIGDAGGLFYDATWPVSPVLDTWYFLVGGYSSAFSAVFISVNNGPAVASASGQLANGNVDFAIGAWQGGGASHWDGQIDEVGFFSRLLSSDELTELWAGGVGASDPFRGISGEREQGKLSRPGENPKLRFWRCLGCRKTEERSFWCDRCGRAAVLPRPVWF